MDLSGKVQGRHLDRLAMVYVRQSTLRQVEQNQESTRLQYALVEHAQRLGWARGRVEVIDDLRAGHRTRRLGTHKLQLFIDDVSDGHTRRGVFRFDGEPYKAAGTMSSHFHPRAAFTLSRRAPRPSASPFYVVADDRHGVRPVHR